jgi:fatty-acyl-CoA synthase
MQDKTLHQVLEETAARFPHNDAVVYVDRGLRWSYREFNERCRTLAKGLLRCGITRGSHVAVWAYNVPEWLLLQYALPKIGAVLVTVNTYYKSHELEYLLKQSDAAALFLVQGFKDVDYVGTLEAVLPELPDSQPGALDSAKLPFLHTVAFMGEGRRPGMLSFEDLMAAGAKVPDAELDAIQATLSPDDVINMQYTSGTTGFPKGVMLTHRNIIHNAWLIGERMGLTERDRYLIPVPFFHCFGCVLSTLNCVVRGATMVPIEIFDAQKVLAAVERERCTAINGVPTMFIAELRHPEFGRYDLSTLRTGIMAGATCPEEVMRQVMEQMHAREMTICYGLTETAPVLTQTGRDDSVERRVTTVGRVLPDTDVRIVDPETGAALPAGTPGELVARGYGVMKGYYKMPEATANTIRGGWLHTKDLAVMDASGYVRILGRVDDMIIRGGENVYPREIEEFLYTHPKVKDIAVVGVPSDKYGEEVMAFVQLREGERASVDEIQEYCKARISRFKVPKYITFVEHYPMTASGKIQKFKLREMGRAILKQNGLRVA